MATDKEVITRLLKSAGVMVNGLNPWDIQVHNEEFYRQLIKKGDLGFGESYIDGHWDCEQLDELFYRLTKAELPKLILKQPKFWRFTFKVLCFYLLGIFYNFQKLQKNKNTMKIHYNLGNDLYQSFLDSSMQYSCGYWQNADNLNQAQLNKMDLICQKLDIQPSMKILDIGCGWGGLARYIAEQYKAKVYGITVSKEQLLYAKNLCKGLPVTLLFLDYRDLMSLHLKFDRIISVGMFEHVGHKNYAEFMTIVSQILHPNGLFLLHTIGNKKSSQLGISLWIEKYIFPYGSLPSIAQIGKAIEGKFIMEDWHNFGAFYDHTLLSWYNNFCQHWPQLKNKYDDRFFRMWIYYLASCAGGFRSRHLQLWQIVLSPQGVLEGYKRIGEQPFIRPAFPTEKNPKVQ